MTAPRARGERFMSAKSITKDVCVSKTIPCLLCTIEVKILVTKLYSLFYQLQCCTPTIIALISRCLKANDVAPPIISWVCSEKLGNQSKTCRHKSKTVSSNRSFYNFKTQYHSYRRNGFYYISHEGRAPFIN